ncbi:MAG: VanW family protein [Fibrella sp.]|nr:VanW family protein [Armatimonadota bacterium]
MTKILTPSQPLADSAIVSIPENSAMAGDIAMTTPTRRPKPVLIVALVTGGVLASVAGVAVARVSDANRRAGQMATVFAPGVKVADISLAGLSREDGASKVRAWAKTELTTRFVALVAPESGRRFLIPLAIAGARYDTESALSEAFAVGKQEDLWSRLLHGDKAYDVNVTPAFKMDDKSLTKQLAAVGAKIAVQPKNARAKMVEGVLQITQPEQKGVALDADATRTALLKNGVESLRGGEQVAMVITETEPKMTSDNLGNVNTLLASYTTSFGSSSAARQSNIRKATAHMNGTLLAPGEVFSYNDIVGPRSPRLGWRNAPTYQDGQVVPGPGGGICQTSTTLYNAVLRANLKVVERRNHSMPVHYVPAGCDATVDYGSQDFKFANNTPGPVYVQAITPGGRLTFNLCGTAEAMPPKIDVVTGGHSARRGGGFAVAAYKVIHEADGTKKREYLGTSSYRPMASHSAARPRPRRRPRIATPKPTTPAIAQVAAPQN